MSDEIETIDRNPKSWAAWKREAERLQKIIDDMAAMDSKPVMYCMEGNGLDPEAVSTRREVVEAWVNEWNAEDRSLGEPIYSTVPLYRHAQLVPSSESITVTDDMAYEFHHALTDSMLGADEVEEIKTGLRAVFANLTAPVVSAECPERLPCSVLLEPGLRFGKGIKTSTVLAAFARRAVYESDMAALSPEEKAEFRAKIADFKALIAQPSPVVPEDVSGPLAHAYKELTPTFMRNHIAVFERYGIAPNDSSTVIQALRIALDGIDRRAAMLQAGTLANEGTIQAGNSPAIPGAEQRIADAVELLKQASPAMLADNSSPDGPLVGRLKSPGIGIDPASGPDRTVEVRYVAPPGYVMVPKDPTDEMIAAAMNCEDVLFNSDESFCVQFGNIYEAMLAAVPQEVKGE